MKRRQNEPVYRITINGLELEELKKQTGAMAEAFGLDRRIDQYQGKRAIQLHAWDLDCLESVLSLALHDDEDYPEKRGTRYEAVKSLYGRIQRLWEQAYGKNGIADASGSGLMDKQNRGLVFRVKIEGAELVELKRHWHHLPEECAGMQGKIQKHAGKRLLELTEEELSWVVAILDAVLQEPKGYPLDSPPGMRNPPPLEFVGKDDPRHLACKGLYERLSSAYERAMKGRRGGTIDV
jgi:hypothetical protein